MALSELVGFLAWKHVQLFQQTKSLLLRKAKVGIHHLSIEGNKLSKDLPNLYVDLRRLQKVGALTL
ncbi:hypothetical protein O9929_04050 [Vibrio lentus]|nr:hypothetical protein [Vibrio lentus]